MLSMRRTRRWKNSNGLVYEEETEVVHMSAGSGGNSTSRKAMQPLQPSTHDSTTKDGSSSSLRLGSIDSVSSSSSDGDGESGVGADTSHLEALAAALADAGPPTGGRMVWHRGSGGFSWSWRRRKT